MDANEIASVRTATDDARKSLDAEIQQWETVGTRLEQLIARFKTLDEPIAELQAALSELASSGSGQVGDIATGFASSVDVDPEAIVPRLRGVAESAGEAVSSVELLAQSLAEEGSLGEILAALEGAVGEVGSEVGDAVDQAREKFEALSESIAEDAEAAFTETAERLTEQFETVRNTLEERMQELMEESFESARDELAQLTEETCEACTGSAEEVVQNLTEAMSELQEQTAEWTGQWSASTREVVDAYSELTRSIEELGQDIDTLRDATTSALEISGIGMNAASRTLEDMMDTMGSVS